MTEGRPGPGETRPRMLARPPGERYATTRGTGGDPASAPSARAARGANLVRATGFGALTALGLALVFALLVGVLDLGLGLLGLAILGGWAIGAAARAGAGSGVIERPPVSVPLLAVAFALAAWLIGHVGAYLVSLLIRPDSSLTFAERISQESFVDWLSPQLGLLQVLEIVLLGGVAWYTSRSR